MSAPDLRPTRRGALAWTAAWTAALRPAPPRAAEAGERIVSVGGAVTEILFELGLGDRVVGVDTTSLHPPEALRMRPNVGYLRALSAEGVLSLRPTLVLGVEGAGPPDVLTLIEGAGVRVALAPDRPSAAGAVEKIEAVARIVGREAAGAALAERAKARFEELAAARARIERPPKVLFVLSAQNGRTTVGGRGTAADGMLALAGATNAAAAIEGFKPMSDEAIAAAAPDAVIAMSQGPGGAASPALLATPGLAGTPAARHGRLVVMDGPYLLGFGPRAAEAARELMGRLHPALALP